MSRQSIDVRGRVGSQNKLVVYREFLKGAGLRNVNKLFSKRRFCSIFDRLCQRDFPLLFSKLKCYFEDRLFIFVEKQMKHSHVVPLQRYWWVFKSNFIVDSPLPPDARHSPSYRSSNEKNNNCFYFCSNWDLLTFM